MDLLQYSTLPPTWALSPPREAIPLLPNRRASRSWSGGQRCLAGVTRSGRWIGRGGRQGGQGARVATLYGVMDWHETPPSGWVVYDPKRHLVLVEKPRLALAGDYGHPELLCWALPREECLELAPLSPRPDPLKLLPPRAPELELRRCFPLERLRAFNARYPGTLSLAPVSTDVSIIQIHPPEWADEDLWAAGWARNRMRHPPSDALVGEDGLAYSPLWEPVHNCSNKDS